MNYYYKHLLLLMSGLLLMCASQGFPPGGPEDRTPPFIVSTFPPSDTTNVSRTVDVTIEFSEPVSPASAEASIFITPFPGETVRYNWKRDRRLTISFGDSLLESRTYIITVGAGTKDRRNNMMEESFTLAFSTGDVLDQGRIRGQVYGDNKEGTQVWLYDLAETPDPNPEDQFPLYITQAGVDGSYRLTNIALSTYRLFAVLDRDMNTRYNVGFDQLGVAHRDVTLDSMTMSYEPMNFRITQRDTLLPMVNSAQAPDNRHVDLRFTEAMRPDSLSDPHNYKILNDDDSLNILNAFMDVNNAAVVHLATEPQTAETSYRLIVENALDLNYLPLLADSNWAEFTGSAVADTFKPSYVTMQPKDSSMFVPLDSPLEFFFSEALQPETVARHLVVADTLADTISGAVSWPDFSHFVFTPDMTYTPETFYQVTLPVDSVLDLAGNSLADTLFLREFTSINPDTLSAIAGTLSDADTTATGAFYMRAMYADQDVERIYDVWLEETGRFEFSDMLPGRYTIDVYRDEDGNRRYSYGEAYPFEPAERYYVYPDTIEIRSRWPSDGEAILLPE